MNIKILNLPLLLTREETYPFLNLGLAPGPLPANVDKLVNTYLRRITQLAKPQGMIRVCSIRSITPERVVLDDASLVIAGSRATAHFTTCEKVTLLAATLGPGIDEHLAGMQLTAGAADAFIFNGIASAAAEHTTEILDAIAVRDIRRSAYYPTARFSPGYGDWPLEHQQQFIESISGEKIGLTVTSHHLLQPVKSVTAVIGWSRVPLERSYERPQGKPCQGTLTCRDCPLGEKCRSYL
ncbi:MAG: Vitamin B12 dependent methionine synthase, activation domain [Firmicutes bacterium ADurb.Bin373]|nr:hypothetical protein [Bacillota bacterium]OQA10558.1 MAG: Vitamin B12 dependent methionine synthase, activation domain [Firmicutes bacterium ADurb.Bin373]